MADRLNALDLAWLELEGTGPPIAMGTVSVAEGPAPRDDELVALVASRIDRMPRLAQVLLPGGHRVRRPVYGQADRFDPAEHVHREAGNDGLAGAVGRVIGAPMPADRPLWDMWIIDDLPAGATGTAAGGGWALAWRVHHSMVDGLGAVATFGHAFDLADGRTLADAVLAPGPRGAGGEAPEHPGGVGHVVGLVAATARHIVPAMATLVPHMPGPLTGPVGPRRGWASLEVPLSWARAVRSSLGTTVNDVVLAIVAGGFRALLQHRGHPVLGQSVRALVPVSTRPPGDSASHNEISVMVVGLPVGIADPVRRLHQVAEAVAHCRGAAEPLVASVLLGAADRLLPAAVQDALVHSAGSAVAYLADTVASNVPGPQQPVYLCGRRVRRLHPVIPVAGHTCISVGVLSYDGQLCFGVTADPDLVADLDVLVAGMGQAATELAAAAGRS